MTTIDDFEWQENPTEGFFNENETEILSTVQSGGTGVYKLTKDKETHQFTAASKVDNVTEEDATMVDGRIEIIGTDLDYLYVKF